MKLLCFEKLKGALFEVKRELPSTEDGGGPAGVNEPAEEGGGGPAGVVDGSVPPKKLLVPPPGRLSGVEGGLEEY